MHLFVKGALAVLFIVSLLACGSEPKHTQKEVPMLPAINSVVCEGYDYEGKGPGRFFAHEELTGACSWYCNPNLVTLPYVGGAPVPRTAKEVNPNVGRLLDWDNRTPALFVRPLTTSLQWSMGLGVNPAVDSVYSRLTAEDAHDTGFGGLLLINGAISSPAAYQRYARLKAGQLFVDDTCVAVVHFADTPKVQWIRLNRLFMLDTLHRRQLRIQITEVYPGQQDTRLAITELQPDGAGGHSTSHRLCPGWEATPPLPAPSGKTRTAR
jgi:hypothetical protein